MKLISIKNQFGDTIVEVLIAILVVSVVLTGAYGAANRSLGIIRQSQERSEALKILEGQIELLKDSQNLGAFTATKGFCMNTNLGGGIINTLDIKLNGEGADEFGNYGGCLIINTFYHVVFSRKLAGITTSEGYIFTVTARWDKVGGGGIEKASLSYKMYGP